MADPLQLARALDAEDPLARFRDEFVIDDPNLIYVDGNSLGRLPKRTIPLVAEVLQGQWGDRLIRGYGESWFDLPQRLGAKIAQLVGAHEDEVILGGNTSSNLYQLVNAILPLAPDRREIVTDDANFPSDWYVLQGVARQTGHSVVSGQVSDRTALLTLSHVTFKTGELNDMRAITEEAQRHGAFVLWDLSHSVGAVTIDLADCNADLAVGCTYKYLNSGPGASAFLYVRRDLQERLSNPIQGWFGREQAFDFGLDYHPRPGILRFLTGSPNVLSMAPVESGVDLVLEAGIENLRAKSLRQTDFLIDLWRDHLEPLGFSLNSPLEHTRRGSHVALGHEHALSIVLALVHEMGVVPDFRTPDNIRYGCTPLYTTFTELAEAVLRTKAVVEQGLYRNHQHYTPTVT